MRRLLILMTFMLVVGLQFSEPSNALADGGGILVDSGQSLGNSTSFNVALGDVDGDGDMDAFITNYQQANKVWLNDGAGAFYDSGQSLGNSISKGVTLGDLDNDGDLDAFIANRNRQGNKIWLNDGTGHFTDSGQSLGNSDSYLGALGDVDGDGDLDAFVANAYSPSADKVWLNDGTATFTDSGQSLGNTVSVSAELGDLDGDGDLDAFVGTSSSQGDKVWLNDGTGIFSDNGQSLGNSSNLAALGDMDGDGDLDAFMAVSNDTDQGSDLGNQVWFNDGLGAFTDSGQRLGNSTTSRLSIGDVDNDGDLDAFVANVGVVVRPNLSRPGEANKVWLNNGAGIFSDSGQDLGSSASRDVALEDLDGDGDLDAFIANSTDTNSGQANNKVWLNQSLTLLSIHVLAVDNAPSSDLSWTIPSAMESIKAATANDSDKTALVLVDQPGDNNTVIYEVRDGVVTAINGLPDGSGALSTAITEYNTADGPTLGGFLLWAQGSYTADKVTFSYVGHGGPFLPETDYGALFGNPPSSSPPSSGGLFPLPILIQGNPTYTDMTPAPDLLSAYDIGEALRIGTSDGSQAFDVVDLTHCFSSTLEELFEVYPYAEMLTSAPNYDYLAPKMLGQALDAMQPSMSAEALADTMIQEYDKALADHDDPDTPTDDHPRSLVAVQADQIPLIAGKWHEISYHLMQNFDAAKVENAYRASAKYDTTYCAPQDWALDTPDALVDIMPFASQLGQEFGGQVSTLVMNDLVPLLQGAVKAHYRQGGDTWYAKTTPKPTWSFDDIGIGLYADFVGTPQDGQTVLSWHAHWYGGTVTADNPHPYRFLQNGYLGTTWANVLDQFWQGNDTLATAACLPQFPPIATNIDVICGDTEIYPGDTIPIDVRAAGVDVYGLETTCSADATILQPQQATFGEFLSPEASRIIQANNAKQQAGTWFGAANLQSPALPVTNDAIFATIPYIAIGSGTTDISCDPLASDIDGFEIAASTGACTLTVLPFGTISGTISYQGRLDHTNIAVTATGALVNTAFTDSNGNFAISDLRGGSYQVSADANLYLGCTIDDDVTIASGESPILAAKRLRGGDVNDDGVINIDDASILGGEFGTTVDPAGSSPDINADGRINTQDSSMLHGNYEQTGCLEP